MVLHPGSQNNIAQSEPANEFGTDKAMKILSNNKLSQMIRNDA